MEAGDTLALDPANVTVTVLNPPADPGTDDYEAPVVLRLVYGSQWFLLAGDAEQAAEGWMLASGRPLASRILKVGHHGRSTARARVWIDSAPIATVRFDTPSYRPGRSERVSSSREGLFD